MPKKVREAPKLNGLVKKMPNKISVGKSIDFLKPTYLVGYLVTGKDPVNKKFVFGNKDTYLVETGKVIFYEKNLVMLLANVQNKIEVVIPLLHDYN